MQEPSEAVRQWQSDNSIFFRAMYDLSARIRDEFYPDVPDLPKPLISLDDDRPNRRGWYMAQDGALLMDRINLNIDAIPDGLIAAEVLAHEMVHMFENHVGTPCVDEHHGSLYHDRMRAYGIETIGDTGRHVGYFGTTWHDFLARNGDLNLSKFTLPGSEPKVRRQMHKHQCQVCDASFQSRRLEPFTVCLECEAPFIVVS